MYENEYFSEVLEQINSKLQRLEKLAFAKTKSVLDIDEASELIKMSKFTLYAKTSKGDVPHYKEGRKIYFKRDELLEHITRKENRRKSNAEIESEAATLTLTKGRGHK